MCAISMIAQDWSQRNPTWVHSLIPNDSTQLRADIAALKTELESLKKLLKAAKIYDDETGQKDCEDPEKVALFKRLAEMVGVDLTEVFGR
jgi:hypothetical protein